MSLYHSLRQIILPLALWSILWLSIQSSEINKITRPGLTVDFLQGVSSALPFFAAYLALLLLVFRSRRTFPPKYLWLSPMGLASLYGVVGVFASVLSPDASVALYWAALYLTVPLVLWAITWNENPLERITLLVNFNWAVISAAVVTLFVISLVFLNLWDLIYQPSLWGSCPLNGSWKGESWVNFTSGAIRPTGVGRYAAITAIISLVGVYSNRWRFGWTGLLIISLILLGTSGARTALLGFMLAALVVSLVYGGKKGIVY